MRAHISSYRIFKGSYARFQSVKCRHILWISCPLKNPVQSKCIAYEIWDSYAVQVRCTGFFNGHEIHSKQIFMRIPVFNDLQVSVNFRNIFWFLNSQLWNNKIFRTNFRDDLWSFSHYLLLGVVLHTFREHHAGINISSQLLSISFWYVFCISW